MTSSADKQLGYFFCEADEDGIDAVSEKPSNRKTQSPEIFDLQGRRLTDVTAKGVYILNGKKVVIGNN